MHGEVYIFKTPHHPDFHKDLHEPMVKVALATSAAPTYFRPLEHNGYTLVDGGVWANNPAMLAVIEALICFGIDRDQIDLLSLGCGVDERKVGAGRPCMLELALGVVEPDAARAEPSRKIGPVCVCVALIMTFSPFSPVLFVICSRAS